ncbi:MAG TPA: SusE domain-containing protein [Bacteroidales bacterium]|nr:SusE domain-containing protein [Bacteroidales bacterium]
MKKNNFLLTLMIGATLMACDNRELATVADTITPPVMDAAPVASLTMTEAQKDSTLTFSWQAPNYGYDAAVSYTLKMDIAGAAFANAVDIATVTTTSADVTYDKINTALLTLGGLDGVASNVQIKVVAKVTGLTPEKISSDSVAMTLTPYEVIIVYPHLNLPGSFQPYGAGAWTGAGTDYNRIYSLKSDDVYEGYVNMVRDGDPANYVEFKFTKVDWGNGEYSYSSAGKLVAGGGGNVSLATGGYYKVNADLVALTYSVTKITRWGVIGSATTGGWDSDQAMTYDAATNKWTATLALSVGKIKFRANNGWDINYGDDGADLKLNAGGADIDVSVAGTYTITLDLVGPVYKYKLLKN